MRPTGGPADTPNIIQELVYTLADVFDATRDLYETLSIKEQRDLKRNLQAKGYPSSRSIQYVEDGEREGKAAIDLDRTVVLQQFEAGHQALGPAFAIGDVYSQTALQAHIITLQSVLVTTFLYGPTSAEPLAAQLAKVKAASRTAGTEAVEILLAQQKRQQNISSSESPITVPSGSSSASTALMKYEEPRRVRGGSPVNTTILERRGRSKIDRTDTDTTVKSGQGGYGAGSDDPELYCLYAIDLQRDGSQPLSSSITSSSVPSCPACRQTLHLSAGKAWEIFKQDSDGYERCFQVSNRFMVKCHRPGPDGQFACVLCSRHSSSVTITGDVKALVKHMWEDHDIRELKHEEDIVEIIEQPRTRRRRDSVTGGDSSRVSRRSSSRKSRGRHRSLPAFEREVETFEIRSPRRGA